MTEENRDKVYRDASRERSVVAFCSMDDASSPVLRDIHGQIFAVLPTDVRIPFGLHLQADWLLNLSRTGIRDTEDNQWQQEILQQVPHLIRRHLEWLVSQDGAGPAWSDGYDALPDLDMPDDGRYVVRWFSGDDFRNRVNDVLKDAEVFPFTSGDGEYAFVSPKDLVALPEALGRVFSENISLHPHVLFGTQVLASAIIGPRAYKFFDSLLLVPKLTASDMTERWKGGLGYWLKEFIQQSTATALIDGEARAGDAVPVDLSTAERLAISSLYSGLQELESDASWREAPLHIVPTRSNAWRARSEVQWLEGFEFLGKDEGPVGHAVRLTS